MKTMQEVFDKAVSGLIKQGVPSKYMKGCQYHNAKTGSRCVVGQLFCEDIDTGNFEGLWVQELDRWMSDRRNNGVALDDIDDESAPRLLADALIKSGVEVTPLMVRFLTDLQGIHDGTDVPADDLDEEGLEQYIHDTRQYWKERFAVIADKYFLDKTVLN